MTMMLPLFKLLVMPLLFYNWKAIGTGKFYLFQTDVLFSKTLLVYLFYFLQAVYFFLTIYRHIYIFCVCMYRYICSTNILFLYQNKCIYVFQSYSGPSLFRGFFLVQFLIVFYSV